MQLVSQVRTRCQVCGFSEVRTDEAVDRARIFLAECPRCEHRWTSSGPTDGPAVGPTPLRPGGIHRVVREAVPAA